MDMDERGERFDHFFPDISWRVSDGGRRSFSHRGWGRFGGLGIALWLAFPLLLSSPFA